MTQLSALSSLVIMICVVPCYTEEWVIEVEMSTREDSDTSEDLYIELTGTLGKIGRTKLENDGTKFQIGSKDRFVLQGSIGIPYGMAISIDGTNGIKFENVKLIRESIVYTFTCKCEIDDYGTKYLTTDEWTVQVETGSQNGAQTNDSLYIQVNGTKGITDTTFITGSNAPTIKDEIGTPYLVKLLSNSTGLLIKKVTVTNGLDSFSFSCDCWINGSQSKSVIADACNAEIPNCVVQPEACFICPQCKDGYFGSNTEKCAIEWSVAVETSSSGTDMDLAIEVNGTHGDVNKTVLFNDGTKFQKYSSSTFTLYGDIGKPYSIILSSLSQDGCQVEKVTLTEGLHSYTFTRSVRLDAYGSELLIVDGCNAPIPFCIEDPQKCFLCPKCKAGYQITTMGKCVFQPEACKTLTVLEESKSFTGGIIKSMNKIGVQRCMKECLSIGLCKAMSYNVKTLLCVLGGDESQVQFTSEPVKFVARTVLQQLMYIGSCSQHTCPSNKICFNLKSGNAACLD